MMNTVLITMTKKHDREMKAKANLLNVSQHFLASLDVRSVGQSVGSLHFVDVDELHDFCVAQSPQRMPGIVF